MDNTVIRRTHTALTYQEEQYVLMLVSCSDDQLLHNLRNINPNSPVNRFFMFTTFERLTMHVESEFADTSLFSELSYRGLEC